MALDVRHAEAHQGAVIDCLEDPDPTLRKTTLELLAAMTHEENVEVIADRMLAFLRDPAVSPEMRVTLGTQLAHICTAYGPTVSARSRQLSLDTTFGPTVSACSRRLSLGTTFGPRIFDDFPWHGVLVYVAAESDSIRRHTRLTLGLS